LSWKLDFQAWKWSFVAKKLNKQKKDHYIVGCTDWNYHIRGRNINNDQIRIAISFDKYGMPIITVINLDEAEDE
jgi:hypothetical protein